MKKIIVIGLGLVISRMLFAQSAIKEPYPWITAHTSKVAIAHSPDPLVNMWWPNPKASDNLEIYTIKPVAAQIGPTGNVVGNIDAAGNNSYIVKGPCTLMFDFGQVNAAWMEFDSDDLGSAELEMSISEYNEPAVLNSGAEHPVKTAVPKRYGSTYRLELNKELYEGVRFGWINVKKINHTARLRNVRLICQIKPTNYEGAFACSDTMLTRIWYTGAYDVKLNLLHDYFGAILMERSDRISWTGDAYPSQAASMVAFGNFDFVKKNLYNTSTQFNGIASYSLYWVLSLLDYYMYTGDRAMFDEMRPNLCAKLDTAYEHFDRQIHLGFNGWDERLGAGFENPDCDEAQYVYRMLSLHVWKACSEAFAESGQTELAAKYGRYYDEKSASFREKHKDLKVMGLHSIAEGLNADFFKPSEYKDFRYRVFGYREERLSYSPFNQFFIINGMAKMGLYDEALTTIDDCWGGQIRYGGTTFFEVFRPSWNIISKPNDAPVNNQCGYTSMTHPWSAGVTKWLSEEMLGIKATSPGFKTFMVKPHLSDREWVKGTTPTPHGPIHADFDMETGLCSLIVPVGTTATLAIPKDWRTIASVEGLNVRKSDEDNDYLYFKNIKPGKYSFKVNYEGKRDPVLEEDYFCYPMWTLSKRAIWTFNKRMPCPHRSVSPLREDSLTQGAWRGHYGKLGYVLCNYDSIRGTRMKLPTFVDTVIFTKNANVTWYKPDKRSAKENDPRALESDTENAKSALGAITTIDPVACLQTMTIDIHGGHRQRYNLSLYFVDWERAERRSAIEIFDFGTKELALPLAMVRHYENGKYLTFEIDRPVRIRINQVRGKNAAVSGIFFDDADE